MRKAATAVLVFACSASAASPAIARDASELIGCWERWQNLSTKFPNHHLVCFNAKGVMSGVTFDAGDAWDWPEPYVFDGDRIYTVCFRGERCELFAIKNIDGGGFDAVKNGELVRYKKVCRTKEEDIQCERLDDELPKQ